jgi:hypothetical protein
MAPLLDKGDSGDNLIEGGVKGFVGEFLKSEPVPNLT